MRTPALNRLTLSGVSSNLVGLGHHFDTLWTVWMYVSSSLVRFAPAHEPTKVVGYLWSMWGDAGVDRNVTEKERTALDEWLLVMV
ncbi:hypothetical protein SARC_17116 [Sphaeroforma arctica JP610]|uniref:Uncharacterized protein n=1 Tax=Sphaeroforma arctica JP610 TaxID=667725 RepID=A0A0L0F123_9EUKA|nr:hypothetical protein SARC_17116 [Sphaeroforma arctica JP610]KNC70356.1 hypothetical protein SARC_17116 [Sphaeroforma arctica JP610]|eukprot:XP_014144258.1 hypothetical protein SARC_17116 [Sphaeroforma arctica JP610]